MKQVVVVILSLIAMCARAQELFVVTDPASNVPTNSLSIRFTNSVFKEVEKSGYNYHWMPELSYGATKNLMFKAAGFVSNRSSSLYREGGSIYSKYRFYSADDLNSHFRLAAYGRYSFNRADIHQEQIEIMGHNTGYEGGIVATKLIHKTAVSASMSYEKALFNRPEYPFPSNQGNEALNYTLSVGRLMHPKTYTNFKQTNINLMVEVVGQTIGANGKSYVDIVPAIQFIFFSQARVDIAYRRQVISSMNRTAPNGLYLNLEYTFFRL